MKEIKTIITFSGRQADYIISELKKYVLKVSGGNLCIKLEQSNTSCKDALVLGMLSHLSLDDSDLTDPMVEDIIDVDVKNTVGHIAGSNARSVLMGVYKYFKSVGCSWVRPGDDGEYIPRADLLDHSFSYRKKADYHFRGQCVEGAVSFEHIRDTILWLPKIDMNMFMLEQIVPYNYMSRWYTHEGNTMADHTDIPYEKYCEYCLEIEETISKCGLQFHALGHGALNEPFGIRYLTRQHEYNVSEKTKNAFAMLSGKRELYKNSPFFTQFCMSNNWVRETVTDWLVEYIKQKPHIDFLHFWLADSINNHCECEECVKKTPSDWYVILLNKLDEKLTRNGISTKVVFIMYTDTLWPPIEEKLNNPSRFILTTACGSGTQYSAKRREGGIPKWERNNYKIKAGIDMALTFIDGWKPVFDGPKFIYEYCLYTNHFSDPGYMNFSKQIANDIKNLHLTEFDGIMSDQTQRCYFPTGLPSSVMGHTLFDVELDTESFADEYFKCAYGDDWKLAKEYLQKISDSFDIKALSLKLDVTAQDTGSVDVNKKKAGIIGNERVGNVIAQIPQIADEFEPIINKNLDNKNDCHRTSWQILGYHAGYCKAISEIYYLLSRDDREGARAAFEKVIDYISGIEHEIHPYFDLCLFIQRTKHLIND